MDAVSNVGVWMDKIYMGDKSQGGGGGGGGGWRYHSGGSQMGMGSMILCILPCIFCVCLSVLCNLVYSLAAWLPLTSCVSTNGSRRGTRRQSASLRLMCPIHVTKQDLLHHHRGHGQNRLSGQQCAYGHVHESMCPDMRVKRAAGASSNHEAAATRRWPC